MKPLVLIPSYHTAAELRDCLASFVQTQGYGAAKFLILENGSGETDRRILENLDPKLDLEIVWLPANYGYVGGINVGLTWRRKYCPDSLALFLNADVVFWEPGWLDRWQEFLLEHPDVGVVGPVVSKFVAWPPLFYDLGPWGPAHWVTGCVLLVTPAVLRKVPEIDMVYSPGYWDDADFCFEAFWVASQEVWSLPLNFHHLGMAASRNSNFALTATVRNARELTLKQQRNRNYFLAKWREVLCPKARSWEEAMRQLDLLRARRDAGGLPASIQRRHQLLRQDLSSRSWGGSQVFGGPACV